MSSRFRIIIAIGLVVSLFAASISAAAQENGEDDEITNGDGFDVSYDHDFAAPQFFSVWERTDYPVQQLEVARTWIWGPGPITEGIIEDYAEGEDGERLVQYFDKSRMEWPVDAQIEEESEWFITQGLLATELMTGDLQIGHEDFETFHDPAEIYVAGDWADNQSPTYAAMGEYIDWEPRPEGATITQTMDEEGNIDDEELLEEYGVTDAYFVEQTNHNIASVFWEFMQSEGLIYVDDDYATGPIFLNEFYAVGYPITEAYWGWVTVDGVDQNVLIQCFERRCLTYTPDNPEGWEVESGNIGLHYYMWRYHQIDRDPPVDPELSLALSPDGATNTVDTEFVLTATVMENGTALDIDSADDVSITVNRDEDDNVDVEESIALDNGAATITYTGPAEPAVDTITVTVEYGEETLTETTTKTWVEADEPPPELSLALDPLAATNVVDTAFVLTATLLEDETAVEIDSADDVSIAVSRGDVDVDVEEEITLENGSAVITYEGPSEPAVDEITVTVDVDGEEITADSEKLWCSAIVTDEDAIQGAIEGASEGALICVEAGTYEEEVEIDVDGLTLLALDGAEETTIQSDTTADLGVVALNADDIVIDGFTIDNEDAENGRAIRVNDGVDGVTIQNSVLVNAFRGVQGNWTSGGDNITITNNTFTDSVVFGIAGTEDMDGLVVADNTFETTEEGIGLGDGLSDWTIEDNHFAGEENHVVDYREPFVEAGLEEIIDDNTFENDVVIVGNAIRDDV